LRLPGRLAAAIDVLAEIETRHRPVSEALKSWGLANRFAGSGDRAAIGNLVYDALRRRASHGWAMGADTPRALVLSVAVRDWGEAPGALSEAFAAGIHAPAALTADELARLSAGDPLAGAPDHVRADLPEWIASRFEAALGADWIAEGAALAARPPLDLRVNTLKSSRERVKRALQRLAPEETTISPIGVRFAAGPRDARTPNVLADEGYLKGWFEVQDQGSQLASLLAGAAAGEQVLDLCAGAGGKTLALAAAMENKGQIFAHDSERPRLAPIYDRLKRSGVRNVQVRAPEPGALDDLVGRMDRVLVDAPCTGAGTWRRRPDAKWKLNAAQLAQRAEQQRALLAEAARFLKPGGALVYVTCSLLADENEEQVDHFLRDNSGFAIDDPSALWRGRFPAIPAPRLSKAGLSLSPLTTGTDGFFIAVMRRN
jgi:16S rRNA (cytosine967-C5)-methyltransferase